MHKRRQQDISCSKHLQQLTCLDGTLPSVHLGPAKIGHLLARSKFDHGPKFLTVLGAESMPIKALCKGDELLR